VVTLIKTDSGERIENVSASVQPAIIFVEGDSLPVAEGDYFERALPSGVVERYLVLEASFHNKIHSLPSHFQIKVRKETSLLPPPGGTTNNYHLNAPNARVNIGSTDQSINVVNQAKHEVFADLRKVVLGLEDPQAQEVLLPAVGELEASVGTPSYLDRYQGFIQQAANHMTLIGPFIPALSQLLSGH
jgi:hypothetical protein